MEDILKNLDSEAQRIVAKYDQKNASLLTLLHLGQDRVGYISPEVEAWASKWSEVPLVHVHEVVTFYTMYHQKPAGKHHIRFCSGTSCMLRGHEPILDHLKKKLKADNHETTTDGQFSLEEAECLCACEQAPMMQVDGKYYGNLTEEKIEQILNGLK